MNKLNFDLFAEINAANKTTAAEYEIASDFKTLIRVERKKKIWNLDTHSSCQKLFQVLMNIPVQFEPIWIILWGGAAPLKKEKNADFLVFCKKIEIIFI